MMTFSLKQCCPSNLWRSFDTFCQSQLQANDQYNQQLLYLNSRAYNRPEPDVGYPGRNEFYSDDYNDTLPQPYVQGADYHRFQDEHTQPLRDQNMQQDHYYSQIQSQGRGYSNYARSNRGQPTRGQRVRYQG